MKLTTRNLLVGMTLVAVASDSLLHPFYPQFFETAFGVTDPRQVGYYFSALCFMVMISFPCWALAARRIPELQLLVYTQLAAGLLAVSCVYIPSYAGFWGVSLVMVLFKGSYLLVYPLVLRLSDRDGHVHTIGLLSVIVHFGSILGAVAGGLAAGLLPPRWVFFIMAAGDFLQMALSLYLLKTDKAAAAQTAPPSTGPRPPAPAGFVWKLGIITLVLYFSYFLTNPFFSRYWESVSRFKSTVVSGAAYALPGFVALAALWLNHRQQEKGRNAPLVPALLLGAAGLALQAAPLEGVVVAGRLAYGWAVFQAMVRFDALLFQLSQPEDYATDYSKVHFFQNLGVLAASFAAGLLVNQYGLVLPFLAAGGGFLLTLALYVFLFKQASAGTVAAQA